MSSTPLVSSAIPGEPAHIQSVLAHQPELRDLFNHLYGLLWSRGRLPVRIKEITRLRNARVTGCGYCVNVRFAQEGQSLPEAEACRIDDAYAEADFSPREVAALAFTDVLVSDPRGMKPELRAALVEHFTPEELIELALCVAAGIATEKVLITLGLEPEPGTMPLTVLPVPEPGTAPDTRPAGAEPAG